MQKSQQTLTALRDLVGAERVLTDSTSLQAYGTDWTRFWAPNPLTIVLPGSDEEVQQLVRLANARGIALVPSGGRTGLSGGAVAAHHEVVVALDRMNRIKAFNAIDRTVVCEAGVITRQLQQFAADQGLFYPVDFAASGSSQIGGNISTNAGGIKVIRYGMTRDWVLGLKVVTGAGELLALNGALRKNNAGYDLRQLFIGGEGTLGIVVEATLRLARPPRDLKVLVLGTPTMDAVMEVLQVFQQRLDLTAFEFFTEAALTRVVAGGDVARPFPDQAPVYVLLEFERPDETTEALAMSLFETCLTEGWVTDGVMSQNERQATNLWRCREHISESIARWTPYKNDIAVPVSRIPELLEAVESVVSRHYPDFEIIWFGHIGDGNVHLNILKPDALESAAFMQQCHQVSRLVFEIVQQCGGSISAEHGVGLLKKDYLGYTRSPAEIQLMKAIRRVFDPNGVLNPGKMLDA
jgi:glycolate oxidase subunit GlcD